MSKTPQTEAEREFISAIEDMARADIDTLPSMCRKIVPVIERVDAQIVKRVLLQFLGGFADGVESGARRARHDPREDAN